MKLQDVVRFVRSGLSRAGLKASGLAAATLLATPQLALAGAAVDRFAVAPGGYTPMAPTPGKGMPIDGGIGFQHQYSPNGEYALWMHDAILMPVIFAVAIFVGLLLIWVMVRYNSKANPVASKISHHTMLEVIWTGVPILILVVIFIPSMKLLAKQYAPAPANALTVKATGNQWYWTYKYPDNGDFEVTSDMLNIKGEPTVNSGVRYQGEKPWDGPAHLEVDNRMVVPAGEPIRIQTTGADVIHSFAVPSLWFKIDAVPGRINERVLFIKEPGVYYGQCSELCGARHGYMPIVVEALPRAQFNAWVLTHGGAKIDGAPAPAASGAPAAGASGAASSPGAAPAAGAASSAAGAAAPTA